MEKKKKNHYKDCSNPPILLQTFTLHSFCFIIIVLHCELQILKGGFCLFVCLFLTNWRFVVTLCGICLSAPFSQQHLLALCLCLTFLTAASIRTPSTILDRKSILLPKIISSVIEGDTASLCKAWFSIPTFIILSIITCLHSHHLIAACVGASPTDVASLSRSPGNFSTLWPLGQLLCQRLLVIGEGLNQGPFVNL